jgi:biopolymer transport protein ExbB/biopolymer transport protein TolQ
MIASWTDLWLRMGPFAIAVVAVLVVMSVVALEATLRKWWELRQLAQNTREFAPRFSQALESNDPDWALDLSQQYQGSHLARVLGEAMRVVKPLIDEPRYLELAASSAFQCVEREQILLATELKKGLGTLATIGATSPFLGLLGTVIGITNSFTALSATGGGIEVVAAGIGEALITTAIGLVVAIPSVWVYNYFTARLERVFSELGYAGRELEDWILRRRVLLEAEDLA